MTRRLRVLLRSENLGYAFCVKNRFCEIFSSVSRPIRNQGGISEGRNVQAEMLYIYNFRFLPREELKRASIVSLGQHSQRSIGVAIAAGV